MGEEHDEQAVFVAEVRLVYRQDPTFIKILFFANANGALLGGNRYAIMNKLREEGFQNGVADILYIQPRGHFTCLAIEMKASHRKRERDGGLTVEQAEFLQAVRENGGRAEVCYNAAHAMLVFREYMALPLFPFTPLVLKSHCTGEEGGIK